MSDENQVMSTADRLIYMANQIARNLASMGEERATLAICEHLTSFWNPRMKARIMATARQQPERLSSTAMAAVELMAQRSRTEQSDPVLPNAVDEAVHREAE